VNELSPRAELFYRRLMSVVDDFGRFDARPALLRGRLFALQLDRVRESDISCWMAECQKVGLIALYTVDGKPYLLFHKLGPARAKESKYPAPPPELELKRASVNGCAQTQTGAPYSYSGADTGAGAGAGPPTPGKERFQKRPRLTPEEAARRALEAEHARREGKRHADD
jgi:hypothetical protein